MLTTTLHRSSLAKWLVGPPTAAVIPAAAAAMDSARAKHFIHLLLIFTHISYLCSKCMACHALVRIPAVGKGGMFGSDLG